MAKFKEYIKNIDKGKKIIGVSTIGVVIISAVFLVFYNILNSSEVSNNEQTAPKKELIIQENNKTNKYTGDKKDFHFNKYWTDMSGGIYTINEKDDITNVEYKKKTGNEWVYMASPVEGKFSDFNYINLKVSGDKGKKLFLKIEQELVELKAKFFTLNGKEQLLSLDISDVKNKNKLDELKEVMLFASPGEVQDGSFKILDAWFSMESATVNKYTGDKKDFHFNKYWEDIFNHGIAIEEENGITTMNFTKPLGNKWILASTSVDGKLSDFNYATIKVKGEAGHKFLMKLEKGENVYGEKLVELSGDEEVIIVKINKDDIAALDSLREVRVFPNAGEPENGKVDILDAWFSVEKPQGFKEAGESQASGNDASYINGWKIEEWTKYVAENINGLTKVTYNNPAEWANFTYNVEGKISGNNLFNIYLNSNGCDHVMIKLRGKFKNVDPVGGFNVYEEVEIFSDRIKQGETNLQIDITDAVRELGNVVDVVMFVESNQNIKDVDRIGSLIFGAPKFTSGKVTENPIASNKWLVEDWTGYTASVQKDFTRISYSNPEPWANISYNIKSLLKDNDLLELKLNSNGCEHVQIKLRGRYLNSAPGYKVYEESLVFDGKLSNGERILKLNLKDAIKELGRENITDIIMFIESNQLIEGLDRKGALDIYTPIFSKDTNVIPNPESPENPGNPEVNNKWIVEDWTGYTASIQKDFTRIAYNNPAEWANISYNIKNLLKDNDLLELKLDSKGCDHVQIKLRGKYLNSDPGYKVYHELLIFDGKLKDGEQNLKLNLKEAIKELGRENITDIIMFVESSQAVDNLDRKGILDIYTPVFKKDVPNPGPDTPEVPGVIKGTKKYELNITKEQLSEIGGKITDVILFVESDGTISDVDRSGEIEILETALLNKEGNKKRIDSWTTDTGWNQYSISKEEAKTTIKYNNVEPWATIWGKVSDDNNFNDKLSIIFNTNGCDHLLVKVKGINGKEVELGKEYVKNMINSEAPDIPKEPIANNIVTLEVSNETLQKIGGVIDKILIFVESNPYGGSFDKSGKLEILETTLQNEAGDKLNINSWTTDIGWNQYKISNEGNKVIFEYNNVDDWAHIISKSIDDYKEGYNKIQFKLNSIGCDHITIKLVGLNGIEEEIHSTKLKQ